MSSQHPLELLLAPRPVVGEGSPSVNLSWATVVSTSPLRIRRDGESIPLLGTPDTIFPANDLEIDDRVYFSVVDGKIVIHGVAGGKSTSIPYATTDTPGISKIATLAEADQNQSSESFATPDLIYKMKPPGVKPSSTATVGGGSSSVLGDGTVVFSSCTAISVRGVFSASAADIYEIFMNCSVSVNSSNIRTRFLIGTVIQTSTYNYMGSYLGSSTTYPTKYSAFATTAIGHWDPNLNYGAPSLIRGSMKVFNPNDSLLQTTTRLESNISASDRYLLEEYGELNNTSAITGFIIEATSGRISGRLKVVKLA